MAKEGMLFTQHYAGCTVSAPSRCSLMTGLHTGHTQVRGNREITPEGLTADAGGYLIRWVNSSKSAGYTTGIFGVGGWEIRALSPFLIRWASMSFMGIIANGSRIPFYPDHLWHNEEKVLFSWKREQCLQDIFTRFDSWASIEVHPGS